MAVSPIPLGYESATPFLCVRGAAAAIEFYRRAFGAELDFEVTAEGGKIGFAELMIGGARIMLCDEFPEHDTLSPLAIGGTPVAIHIYAADVDAFVRRAAAAGARVLSPPQDHFYGDRSAKLEDPFGHRWCVATRKLNLSVEEIRTLAQAAIGPR